MTFHPFFALLIVLIATTIALTARAEERQKPNPAIEAQAPPKRFLTPEETCEHHNKEDGSWWRCLRDEYVKRREPCDVACQLSTGDPRP